MVVWMVFVGWGQRFRFPKQIDLCFLDLSLLWFRSRIRDGGVSLSSGVAAGLLCDFGGVVGY